MANANKEMRQSADIVPPAASMPALNALEASGADEQPEPVSAPVIPAPSMSVVSDEGTGTAVETTEATDKEICENKEEEGKEKEKKRGKDLGIMKLLRQLCKERKAKKADAHEK